MWRVNFLGNILLNIKNAVFFTDFICANLMTRAITQVITISSHIACTNGDHIRREADIYLKAW